MKRTWIKRTTAKMRAGFVFAAVLLSGALAAAATFETLPVCNTGNSNDTTGYGGVDYDYKIGTYEVTAGQYVEFLNSVDPDGSNPYGLYNEGMDTVDTGCQITLVPGAANGSKYDFSGAPSGTAADWADRPVNLVSWGDAARFANWLHNGRPVQQLTGTPANDYGVTEDGAYYLNGANDNTSLLAVDREADWKWAIPTEDEWYKAAYHKNDGDTGNYYLYPTSSDSVPGYVNNSGNLSEESPTEAFVEGGTDPGNYATHNGDDGTWGIGSPYFNTEVGEWENSASPYGTYDQGGNLFEWTEGVYVNVSQGVTRRLARGGSYYYNAGHMASSGRYAMLYLSDSEVDNVRIGFRVVRRFISPGTIITIR